MPKGETSRPARVGERIREELMELVLRGAVKDPRARGAVIHAVKVSGDLRHAKVWVRLAELDPSAARQKELIEEKRMTEEMLRG